MNWEKQPEMPEGNAEWDARQTYVKTLQEINNSINSVKLRIELRDGSADEIVNSFRIYFSLIRVFYRELRPFFKEDEMKEMDSRIEKFKQNLVAFTSDIQNKLIPRNRIKIPNDLEDEMEKFHNDVNKKRFDMKLIVPIKTTDRDLTGISGWDAPGD